MRIISCTILAVTMPLILAAGTINMGSSSGTVSFNGDGDTLTLGSGACTSMPATCTLTGTGSGMGIGTFNWTFTMPNDSTSPFSYLGEPSTITTAGTPALSFSLSDTNSDSATGTFALTDLLSDGGSGVDIDGTVTINSITPGSNIGAFDSFFGLPSSTPLAFTLDVGSCTSGRKSEICIQPSDPTAQYISLQLTPGTPIPVGVPEPGTFALLGSASAAIFAARRWRSRKP